MQDSVDQDPQEDEKRLSFKLHVNMGHPDSRKFCRVLRAGGVGRRFVRWACDKFRCDECHERQRSGVHRRVALPRTFRFNRVVG
eukprot:7422340-Pyramimonas_sp.AAC.1